MTMHTITRVRPRKKRGGMERFIIDIETWRLNARNFAFAVIMDWEGTFRRTFYSPEEVREFLDDRPGNVVMYAHNCWKFDGLAFYSLEELMDADRLVAGNRIVAMTFLLPEREHLDEDRRTIEWRDTVALMPISISRLGDSLNLPKGETPIDYIKGNRREITPDDIEYCVRDVEILRQGLHTLEASFNEWCHAPPGTYELPLTSASMAYRVWCERHWPEHWVRRRKRRSRAKARYGEVLLDEDGNPKVSLTSQAFCVERANVAAGEAYYGGRVQVIGEPARLYENVHSVDANSLYPSVMINPYPDITTVRQLAPTEANLNAIINDPLRLCWANVQLIATDATATRFLPNTTDEGRRKWDDLLFDGWICEPEIVHALASGYRVGVVRGLYCAKPIEPFTAFVRHFYQLRLRYQREGDAREFAVKTLMNALYGRFGMRDMKERIDQPEKVADIIEEPEWTDRYSIHFYDGPRGQWAYLEDLIPTKKSTSTWFGFAAFATSYARVELSKVIEAAGDSAIYCDTDSVHFTADGYDSVMEAIEIGHELGQWKHETPPEGIPYAKYWECKAYVHFGTEMDRLSVKHKGVSVRDDEGKFKPEAGDLTKAQTHLSTVQFYTAARRGLEPGTELVTTKRSKRWFKDE